MRRGRAPTRYRSAARARRRRGLTLVEVMVSIAVVAMIGTVIFGAFQGMSRARDNMEAVSDRHHQGRAALSRMSRELGSAFLSAHLPPDALTNPTHQTAFMATDSGSNDRVDFNSFSHRRLRADSHESDQNELSYFTATDPETGRLDLVRRESKYLDGDPARGGIVQVLAEDIESFELRYLDPLTGEWLETWDSTQMTAQFGRLPAQVWITLAMRGGPEGAPARFETKVPLAMQLPIDFANK